MIVLKCQYTIDTIEWLVMAQWLDANAGLCGQDWIHHEYYRQWEIRDHEIACVFRLRFGL